jgi:hypothetical protein
MSPRAYRSQDILGRGLARHQADDEYRFRCTHQGENGKTQDHCNDDSDNAEHGAPADRLMSRDQRPTQSGCSLSGASNQATWGIPHTRRVPHKLYGRQGQQRGPANGWNGSGASRLTIGGCPGLVPEAGPDSTFSLTLMSFVPIPPQQTNLACAQNAWRCCVTFPTRLSRCCTSSPFTQRPAPPLGNVVMGGSTSGEVIPACLSLPDRQAAGKGR